jgi:hypothetical protein
MAGALYSKPILLEGGPLFDYSVTNPPAEPGAFELGPLEAASGRWRGPLKM